MWLSFNKYQNLTQVVCAYMPISGLHKHKVCCKSNANVFTNPLDYRCDAHIKYKGYIKRYIEIHFNIYNKSLWLPPKYHEQLSQTSDIPVCNHVSKAGFKSNLICSAFIDGKRNKCNKCINKVSLTRSVTHQILPKQLWLNFSIFCALAQNSPFAMCAYTSKRGCKAYKVCACIIRLDMIRDDPYKNRCSKCEDKIGHAFPNKYTLTYPKVEYYNTNI